MSDFKQVPVGDVKVVDRHRRDLGDLDALAASIRTVGLLHPIVITSDLRLIAGERRLAAVKRSGAPLIAAHIVAEITDAVSLLVAERDENTCRKDMVPSEKVALGLELEKLERPKAEARHREGSAQGGRGEGSVGSTEPSRPEAKNPTTRTRVSKALGMGGTTYDQAKKVVKAADSRDPVGVQARRDMDETGNVEGAYRYLQRGGQPRPKPTPAPDGPRVYKGKPAGEVLDGVMTSLRAAAHTAASLDVKRLDDDAPVLDWIVEIDRAMKQVRAFRSALRSRYGIN